MLDFSDFEIFNCLYGLEGHFATPCQISWRSVEPLPRCRDFAIFQNGGRLPFRIVMRVLDHPRRAFGGLHHYAKFDWNRCSSFDNMRLRLENDSSCPRNGGFGEM